MGTKASWLAIETASRIHEAAVAEAMRFKADMAADDGN
jgi:hypothetical protein